MESRFITLDCLVDNHYGIYIAQTFAQRYGFLWPEGKEDIDILLKGPDHEYYWDTWAAVLDKFPAHRILLKPQIKADRIVLEVTDDLFIGYYTDKPEATLEIIREENPQSPREWSNTGVIATFKGYNRNNYVVGEENYVSFEHFLDNMMLSERAEYIISYLAQGCDNLELSSEVTALFGLNKNLKGVKQYLNTELTKAVNESIAILEIHSGQQSVYASNLDIDFDNYPADGYIYCDLEKACKDQCLPADSTWGTVLKSGKTLYEQAMENLKAEVVAFNQWIEGDVYGFKLEVHNPETDEMDDVDSCWGFYGDDPKTNGMLEHIPEEYNHLIN